MKVYVTKEFTFDSAHYLPNYNGKCANLHGHTYKLQVTLSRNVPFVSYRDKVQPSAFMVLDFKTLKEIVEKNVIEEIDHNILNNVFEYPTAEFMVYSIFNTVSKELPDNDIKVESVKLWETPDSFAEYRGE